ncbi:hypothetical protein QL285_015168 [Trifolium repens]|nr:hypothetical protein QL285_015167 [Trifolium repens]KAK2444115.1 hypothetical protein QL285_015168 [Trifolium repens]
MKPVFGNSPSLKQVFNTGFSRNRVWIGLYLNGFALKLKSVEHFEVGDLMLSCAEISGVLAVASNNSPGEFLRAEMLHKCGNLMLGCWRHYWGLLEATGIDLKVVGNTQSQN